MTTERGLKKIAYTMSQQGEQIYVVCNKCKKRIDPDMAQSKCCDNYMCAECGQSSDSACETCGAALCDECGALECPTCDSAEPYSSKVCLNCIRDCFYCRHDYCPNHLYMGLVQMAPCTQCGKQPCLDKTHPKETYGQVLQCTDCMSDATEKAKKHKQHFTPSRAGCKKVKK